MVNLKELAARQLLGIETISPLSKLTAAQQGQIAGEMANLGGFYLGAGMLDLFGLTAERSANPAAPG